LLVDEILNGGYRSEVVRLGLIMLDFANDFCELFALAKVDKVAFDKVFVAVLDEC